MIRSSVFIVTLVCLILECDSFAPTINQIPRAKKCGHISSNRPRRIVPKASLSLDHNTILSKATNLLLALESEEAEVETIHAIKGIHLYASKVPPALWAYPLYGVGICLIMAIIVHILLKPSTIDFFQHMNDNGFTQFAETVNGRIAQVVFFLAMFQRGDETLFAKISEHPDQAIVISASILLASLPPAIELAETDLRNTGKYSGMLKIAMPSGIRSALMRLYYDVGLDYVFTPDAEQSNSRWAMVGMGFYLWLGRPPMEIIGFDMGF
jgi:hypothetical protein